MGPKGLKRLCHGCLVNFVFYAHGASMAKSQIGVNRCLQTFKHGLRKSVRPSSFQKAQLQSVSIFFKFVVCLAPFAFAVLFSYYEQLFSCCTQFCDGSLCLSFDNFVAQLLYLLLAAFVNCFSPETT